MEINKYSFGIGDRFGLQGEAQLQAIIAASEKFGVDITPVWNKSNREHEIIGTSPEDVEAEAEEATHNLEFDDQFFVDADHISLSNVHPFISASNFFTIDVADFIGQLPDKSEINNFTEKNQKYVGELSKISDDIELTNEGLKNIGETYITPIHKAKEIYNSIRMQKEEFLPELSMDEVATPQHPAEVFFILKLCAENKLPIQTLALRFPGEFYKGLDYKGDIETFKTEFEKYLMVIDSAIKTFNLPPNLKLSIHSGSDKFSIYPVIGELIEKYNTGIHIKTAGTTWLEEVIGLAFAGNKGLNFAKYIYREGYNRRQEFMQPYKAVIHINETNLPDPSIVDKWSGERFAGALRHIPDNKEFNPDLRQLLHISYKVAAEHYDQFKNLVTQNKNVIAEQVESNIMERHISRLF